MPKKTTKGTIVSEIYAARAIFNMPPPSAKSQEGTLDFVVAAHHRIGATDYGAQVQRQPVTVQIAQIRDVTVKLSSGKSISGAELVEGVQELFEALHTGTAQPDEPPPDADAVRVRSGQKLGARRRK